MNYSPERHANPGPGDAAVLAHIVVDCRILLGDLRTADLAEAMPFFGNAGHVLIFFPGF